jgi:hypothetical protein
LSKTHADAVASHAQELEHLKEQHAAATTAALTSNDSAHKKDLETLKATHAKNLDEAHDRAVTAGHTAHAAELKQVQADHDAAIAVLKKEHAASQNAISSDVEKRKVNFHRRSLKQQSADIHRLPRRHCKRKMRRRKNPCFRSRKSWML